MVQLMVFSGGHFFTGGSGSSATPGITFWEFQNLLEHTQFLFRCAFSWLNGLLESLSLIITVKVRTISKCPRVVTAVAVWKRTQSLTPGRAVCGTLISHSVNATVKICVVSNWYCLKCVINTFFILNNH